MFLQTTSSFIDIFTCRIFHIILISNLQTNGNILTSKSSKINSNPNGKKIIYNVKLQRIKDKIT